MKVTWWAGVLVGLLIAGFAIWQIQAAEAGLEITSFRQASPPLTVFRSEQSAALERPTVLIGHGFAGSAVIMRGYALTLAHAGYNVITWDFAGHGWNPAPLQSIAQSDDLIRDAQNALNYAYQQGLVRTTQVAIMGHSMGSGVALAYGQLHQQTDATVAISPVLRDVSLQFPRNLLLMAGTGEASFLNNARQLLAQAGGEGGDYQLGTARGLVEIQGANHLTILFAPQSHQAALEWLKAVYGPQPGAVLYRDQRIAWYALGILGSLLATCALGMLVRPGVSLTPPTRPLWHRLLALALSILLATLILAGLNRAGLNISSSFGMLVGGYLMAWFAASGILALLFLRVQLHLPSLRTLLAGLVTFAALWAGIGLLGNQVWLPWLLVSPRLVLFPLAAICLMPWFLAVSELVRDASWLGQFAAWFFHSTILLSGLFLAMRLTPGIGFLVLIAPVFPLFFALHALAAGPYRGGWAFALSGTLFTSWMLLAVFPLG